MDATPCPPAFNLNCRPYVPKRKRPPRAASPAGVPSEYLTLFEDASPKTRDAYIQQFCSVFEDGGSSDSDDFWDEERPFLPSDDELSNFADYLNEIRDVFAPLKHEIDALPSDRYLSKPLFIDTAREYADRFTRETELKVSALQIMSLSRVLPEDADYQACKNALLAYAESAGARPN